MDDLSKRFLCGFPVREIQFKNVLNNITWDEQEIFLKNTTAHPILVNKPLNISYQASFLKKAIDYLNKEQIETHDDVYSTYCDLIQKEKSKENYHYKHYKIYNDDSCIVTLKENSNLISNGTTGLHSWEASVVLSEWCIQNSEILHNKDILELGSGAGLAGIITFKVCKPKSLWMSDFHDLVLKLLKENVLLNFNENSIVSSENSSFMLSHDSKILGVMNLLWEEVENFSSKNIPYPEIVIAADVIYDSSIFSGLIKAFNYFLNANKKCEIFLFCTVRNHETLDNFKIMLDNNDFNVVKLPQPEPVHMRWSSSSNVIIYKITNR